MNCNEIVEFDEDDELSKVLFESQHSDHFLCWQIPATDVSTTLLNINELPDVLDEEYLEVNTDE